MVKSGFDSAAASKRKMGDGDERSKVTGILNNENLPSVDELRSLLEASEEESAELFRAADDLRRKHHGDGIFLRGIIEFSNCCRLNCFYCGIRRGSQGVPRYRMTPEEIVSQSEIAAAGGCGTIVLQSGEDPWFTADRLADIIRRIKAKVDVAITLSVGEREREEYGAWKEAGADRYLLRFETSDRALFTALHPDDDFDRRVSCLRTLRELGYQVGSGFMIGLPGATTATIAQDILFATSLELDMIGCGPFIPADATPLEGSSLLPDREIYFRTIALLRLLNPPAHIPATTAFDSLVRGGRERVLTIGANVFMPSVTPQLYRRQYQLYANKPCVDEDAGRCIACTSGRLARMGRSIAAGPGHSLRHKGSEGN